MEFPRGHYVYVGSALNGLDARIRRHLDTSKGSYSAIHWHVDYLLKERAVNIEAVYIKLTEERMECALAESVSEKGIPVPGFGCSDCRCVSHLFRVEGCDLARLELEERPLSDFFL
ncbi:MAG: DUF123 domain-containing protein [Candidatus Bathyarchaeota archaeon]|nr:MAG: DUF123 domain-containing protein [Candidatus Bathyarchaeota archaeon]